MPSGGGHISPLRDRPRPRRPPLHRALWWWAVLLLLLLAAGRPAQSAFTAYTLGANYSKRQSPREFIGNGPMRVSLRLRVMDILAVNEYDSELLLDLLLHRYWREPRIRFTGEAQRGRQYPVDSLDRDKFWTPDLYVLGMREFRPMAGSMGLDHLVLRHDKSVEQLLRATLSMRCQFNFRLFPLDSQECKMDFMSPTLPAEELAMAWWRRGQSVEFYRRRPPLRLPMAQYGARLVPCPRPFTAGHVAGNVSALRVWLVLHRHALSHVLEIYLPTGLFVVISWGSFLVKPEMVPGRMVLLVTNLLSLVTIFEASRTTAPPATGLKCLDVWLVTCIVFLFFALLEYAAILLQLRGRLCRSRSPPAPGPGGGPGGGRGGGRGGGHGGVVRLLVAASGRCPAPSAVAASCSTRDASARARARELSQASSRRASASQLMRKLQSRAQRFTWTRWLSSPRETSWCLLDQLAIFAFPAAFLLFNVVYWSAYLQVSASSLQSTSCERDS